MSIYSKTFLDSSECPFFPEGQGTKPPLEEDRGLERVRVQKPYKDTRTRLSPQARAQLTTTHHAKNETHHTKTITRTAEDAGTQNQDHDQKIRT